MALSKCVGMGPFDDPGPNGDTTYPGTPYSDLRYPGVRGFFTDTHTRWVRFFAEWEYWEPGSSSNPSSKAYQQAQFATDVNIAFARQLGLRVILCTRSFPSFANNSNDPFVFPPDQNLTNTGSPYSNWAFYLMNRYHPVNRFNQLGNSNPIVDPRYRWVDFFEVVNEPNLECHPQTNAAHKTALMFNTCHGIARYLNSRKTVNGQLTGSRPLRLLGPATADADPSANVTSYDTFAGQLLDALQQLNFNFKSNIFGWSHHNYADVKNRMPMQGSRAQRLRSVLAGRWGGYPSPSVNDPFIHLDEGGYVRPKGTRDSTDRDKTQNSDLARAIKRLKSNTGAGQPGDGIAMFTNFLFYTDMYFQSGTNGTGWTGFDSGLCKQAPKPPNSPPADPTALERPAYGTWKTQF